MELPQEIESVRVTGIDSHDVFECINCIVGLRKNAIQDAEVIPGSRTIGLPPCGVEQHFPGFIEALGIEQGNAFVQAGAKQRGVPLPRLAERFERLARAPLVHARDTEVIQPDCCGLIGRLLGGRADAAMTCCKDGEDKEGGKWSERAALFHGRNKCKSLKTILSGC